MATSEDDCLFCKIRDGKIPAQKVHEDDRALAFRDIKPMAPTHLVIVPRKHIATLNDLTVEDEALVGHLHLIARDLAAREGFAAQGYRTLFNTNSHGGQTVFHIHLHLLGGRHFAWPPG
ncbi:MAG TPA: histidine triad nucleotide-binding protein [Polyangia bacterium]|nr:histidine triad nucleotide-binding protein [Polyangia bacterium]